jgi:hypothetical protein
MSGTLARNKESERAEADELDEESSLAKWAERMERSWAV